jgi:hypothetical protein
MPVNQLFVECDLKPLFMAHRFASESGSSY